MCMDLYQKKKWNVPFCNACSTKLFLKDVGGHSFMFFHSQSHSYKLAIGLRKRLHCQIHVHPLHLHSSILITECLFLVAECVYSGSGLKVF